MADDDRFRPRPGRPRAKGGDRIPRFTTKVLRAVSRAGPSAQPGGGLGRSRRTLRMGRGQVAAKVAGQALCPKSRRVVIKARLVNLKRAGPRSTSTHIRYLEREGVTREGAPGQAYNTMDDAADTREFEERGRGDRHQFRFIVSPEDGEDIGELRTFTRQLMEQMERDLGTKLEWVAVGHWDTDDPHTHIVLRGKDDAGKDLIIAPDYISRGMQARARELATEWLGIRTEQEIRQSLIREVTQERWTSLDTQIARQVDSGRIDLSAAALARAGYDRSLLVGRLRHLAIMGLAERVAADTWTVAPDTEHTLRTLSERGDIIRTMQRALGQAQREMMIFDPKRSKPVIGRIADKGLTDELSDRTYVIVDGIDGRAHYARLAANVDIADLPMGGVVELRGVTEPRRVDRSIAELAIDGVYRTETARQRLAEAIPAVRTSTSVIDAHIRRLEALRRGNVVERLGDGVWRVPRDLPENAMHYDQSRLSGVQPVIRSYLPIERQVRALGATWLDEQLTRDSAPQLSVGFGATVQRALDDRKMFLVEHGLAERCGQHIVLARNLLSTLRTKELESTARRIESDTGLVYRSTPDGDRVSGTYRRSLLLASGRFAMIDDGVGFSLVPWRPVIEARLGQSVSAIVRGPTVSWDIGRKFSR
jgi:type IV secretory pathway VirD2 relaxase